MRRADRLFRIIQILRRGQLVTAQMLAEQLEVSERTIYRDMADLQASGVPLDGEAGLGYLLRPDYDLPPLMFTHAESEALAIGVRMVAAWAGETMADAAETALEKMLSAMPDAQVKRAESVQLYAPDFILAPDIRRRLDLLHGAISGLHPVRFAYESLAGAKSERDIHPLGLYFWGGCWTLTGWCLLREAFRTFRVDLMDDVMVRESQFVPVPGRSLADFLEHCVHLDETRSSR